MTRARITINFLVVLVVLGVTAASCAPRQQLRVRRVVVPHPAPAYPAYTPWGEHTVGTRLAEIGPKARQRWKRDFDAAGIPYPAASVEIVVFKREKRVEVYAGPAPQRLSFLRSMPITAASGGPGPKLREGDRQVPEGIYDVDALNPNSLYHVALRLDYPNAYDQRMAARDRRRKLGSAIMIHGSDRSIGCVAVGDEAAEDLFVIAADSGLAHVSVVIVPRDFRRTGEHELMPGQPTWVHDLYATLDRKLRSLPARPPVNAGTTPDHSGGITAR
ncbi:MAG: murein L,D-transpeptidase family protein [Candidatus Binatia bacterium]